MNLASAAYPDTQFRWTATATPSPTPPGDDRPAPAL